MSDSMEAAAQVQQHANLTAFLQEHDYQETQRFGYDRLQVEDQSEKASIQSFFQKFSRRYRDQNVPTVPVRQERLRHKLDPLQQPELGWKDRRKKEEELQNASKDITQNMQHPQKYTGLIREKNEMLFKKRRESGDFDSGPKQPQRAEIMIKDLNPNMFNVDYFAEHYEEVSEEMESLRNIVGFYGQDGAAGVYGYLSREEQKRMDFFAEALPKMEACYQKALATQNLGYVSGGVLQLMDKDVNSVVDPQTGKTLQEDLDSAILEACDLVTQNKTAEEATIDKTIDDFIENNARLSRGNMDEFYGDMQKTFPNITAHFHSMSTYVEVNRYLTDLDDPKYAERVSGNRTAVSKALDEFIRFSQTESEFMFMQKMLSLASESYYEEKHKVERRGEELPETFDRYLDTVKKRQKETLDQIVFYQEHLRDVKEALDHMIYGTGKLTDKTRFLLSEYGDREELAWETLTDQSAGLLTRTIADRDARLTAVVKGRFVDPEERKLILETIGNEPFRLLLNTGAAEDDEALLDLMLLLHKDALLPVLGDLKIKHLIDSDRVAGMDDDTLYALVTDVAQNYVKPRVASVREGLYPPERERTREELIPMQQKLMEDSFTGMLLTRLALIPTDKAGFSQRDVVLEKPTEVKTLKGQDEDINEKKYKGDLAAINARCRMADAMLQQSRAAALLSADLSKVSDPLQLLTETERKEIAGGAYGTGSGAERVEAFARDLLAKGKYMEKTANELLVKDSAVVDEAMIYQITEARRILSPLKPYIHSATELVDKATYRVNQYATEHEMSPVQAETALYRELSEAGGNDELLLALRIKRKLCDNDFRYTGEKKALIGEAMFRSFHSSEFLRGIQDMPEDEYMDMLKDLSEGAFYDEHTPKEKITEAREINERGMRKYFDRIMKHYEYLEQKYGYTYPDVGWVMLHREELSEDFANLQVDDNLVNFDRTVLKADSYQDQRLKELVFFYHDFGGFLDGVYFNAISAGQVASTKDFEEKVDEFFPEMKKHKQYLIEHPRRSEA